MTTDEEPVVVIGSGPSGAAAAHQLVERGLPVVLLDAGPGAPKGLVIKAAGNTLLRRRGWSMYETERQPLAPPPEVVWYSSRSLGGLSNFWTAAVPRFAPEDFADGARLDERFRWPVDYDDLAPYYPIAEHHLTITAGRPILGIPANELRHRIEPPSDWAAVADACEARGDGLAPIPMAKGHPWMVARRGTEFSSYHCVLEPILDRPNFELRPGSQVTKLIWCSNRSRVTEVEYLDRASGEIRRCPTRAAVVAAGTVDTTMILLRSTSDDFPTGLGNGNDVLGRYVHDHPREWWPAGLGRSMRALAHPMYLARASHDSSPPILATSHTIGLVRPAERLRTFVRSKTSAVGVQVFGTMVPEPDFTITLARDREQPTISFAYDDAARLTIEGSRERLRSVLGGGGLDVNVDGPFHDLQPGGSVHLAGSVRMHHDPRFGVLDAWNRVHEAKNVVVCDMAAFTTSPEKNPTLTAMALAIRAADKLADDHAG